MKRPAHLLSHMFWFNLVQQKSNQLNIQSSNDNLTIHDKGRCKPRHRKQVVQGHMKLQQSSCSPWKEPKDCQKDCKKVQHQTSTSLDKWRSSRCPLEIYTFKPSFNLEVCSIPVCPKLQARSKPNCLRYRSFKGNSGEGQEEGLATAAVPHFTHTPV